MLIPVAIWVCRMVSWCCIVVCPQRNSRVFCFEVVLILGLVPI